MVANVVQEQLKHVPFADLSTNESNDSFISCNSKQDEPSATDLQKSDENHTNENAAEEESTQNIINESDCENVEESANVGYSSDLLQMDMEGTKNVQQPKETDESDLDLLQMNEEESQNIGEGEAGEGDAGDLLQMVGMEPEVEGKDVNFLQINTEESQNFEQNNGGNCQEIESKTDGINNGKSHLEEKPGKSAEEVISCLDDLDKDEDILSLAHERKKLSNDANATAPDSQDTITNGNRHKRPSFALNRKVSAFGSFKDFASSSKDRAGDLMTNLNFGVNGEGRRHVLNTIFVKGMRSSNLIARGVAPAARRAVQAMDRKRAQILINQGGNASETSKTDNDEIDNFDMLGQLSIHESTSNNISSSSEEDECIEAIRLLLVQNRVAMGKISPENAALALKHESLDTKRHGDDPDRLGDAGSIDHRLAGCGQVSNAILSAIKLWKDGLVSNGELLELIQKDLQFTKVTLPGSENETILNEDSAFWGRFAFGERWAEKKSRIQSSSTFGAQPGWDLTGLIVKANDDLRQEAFAMQLIELSKEAFEMAGLELWIHPYRILATGRTTGIIEMVRNAMSFDALKKRPGYNEGGLLGHFKKMSEHAADPTEALMTAKRNFVQSLAAYSLLSYFFLFKDRHNGNLLLDTAGHVIHIDFGFMFGIAPGGSFSLESTVPFKLTEEMIEVMDGLGSVLFSEFVTLFCCGFLAMQAHCETFVTIVKITSEGSTFKCFEGKDIPEIVTKLRERFCPDLSKEATIAHAMELIRQATNALGTKQYDFFQYLSQGIAA